MFRCTNLKPRYLFLPAKFRMTKLSALLSYLNTLNIRPYKTIELKTNIRTVTIHRNHRKVEFGRRFKLDDNSLCIV